MMFPLFDFPVFDVGVILDLFSFRRKSTVISPPVSEVLPEPVAPVVVKSVPKKPAILEVSGDFFLDLAEYKNTGERDAILASSGMGKSYLTGVILEETLETGGLVCVIDPEGEHWTLSERYPVLVVGGEHGSLPLSWDAGNQGRVEAIVETVLSQGVSVVFDLSGFIDKTQGEFYTVIADALFRAEQKYRRKIRLIVEEAQLFAPQQNDGVREALTISKHIAKRGRKRGLDSLWATQRPAAVSKDILSQCNRFWFGGIQAQQDYNAIKTYLDDAGISLEQIRALKPGEFYFFSHGKTTKLNVRKRYCKHGGDTPDAEEERPTASKKDIKAIVARLK